LENNIAMLGFYRSSDNSKSKYNLVDQVIDDYADATGIDTANSTGEELLSGYYRGSIQGNTTGATGGTLTTVGVTSTLHTFLSNGTFTPQNAGTLEILLVGAGGCGGVNNGGGGAGGKIYSNSSISVTAGTAYSIVIGAGGVHPVYPDNYSAVGSSAMAGSSTTGFGQTAVGGNHGAFGDSRSVYGNGTGHQGGDGKNGHYASSSYSGNAGGAGGAYCGGGGGGNGAVGGNSPDDYDGGDGGSGAQNNIDGNNYYWGGGGGGSAKHRDDSGVYGGTGANGGGGGGAGGGTSTGGAGYNAGGGVGFGGGSGGDAGDNTGGGGGGGATAGGSKGGPGGSGIVMVKYTTADQYSNDAGDLTLQSASNTAETIPTTGDIVMLIEDAAGTATINTDIKAYISRDGSAFSSAVTLTDEGTWGTNKRILTAHNVDISGITSGTSMKYKITTHNQSTSKETRIHATSLAWA
jgi:hypothetical protein